MNPTLYIHSWVRITRGAVRKDDRPVYAAGDADAMDFLAGLYRHLQIDYPKFYKMDQLSKLGWLASEVLLQEDTTTAVAPEKIGLVVTNANSSLDADRKYFQSLNTVPSPALFVYTLPNILMGEICIRRGYKGENAFFVFPSFDAGFLLGYVGCLFAAQTLSVCLCGWVDCLGEELDAALFLVTEKESPLAFTKENLNIVYKKIT